ncbi:MAG: zinc metalloprotease HtpX [Dehalococcoidia bacterium]|nr:zinc metalloprotease HtpX [Dehalococcoidia bacterium]
MSLQIRLYLLLGAMLGILYLAVLAIGELLGVGSFVLYAAMAVGMVLLQYLIGPSMVSWMMKIKYVSEQEQPALHQMVAELARDAGIPKPKVGISDMDVPNAFAFGRTQGDARICVTKGIMNILNKDELRAVLGHEVSHIKNHDMAFITILSILPMILYYVAMSLIWGGMFGGSRDRKDSQGANILPLIGIGMLVLYFITNLLVLYGSRIREYFADQGSVKLRNEPRCLASALYKLTYWNAKASKQAVKQVEGMKAFFINDPSRAWTEIRELRELDTDMSGAISSSELATLRSKRVQLGFGEKMMEVFQTHPNMLKRIKHLSSLMYQ